MKVRSQACTNWRVTCDKNWSCCKDDPESVYRRLVNVMLMDRQSQKNCVLGVLY